jgi:hypothetical protein
LQLTNAVQIVIKQNTNVLLLVIKMEQAILPIMERKGICAASKNASMIAVKIA